MSSDPETARALGRLVAQHEGMQKSLNRIESDALRILASYDALAIRVTALETHHAATTASRKTILSIMAVGMTMGGLLATAVKIILDVYGVI